MAKATATAPRAARTGESVEAAAAARPWTYQVAFWGLAALLFFPPFFRGLFFPPEQELALMGAAVVFWFTWLWKHGRRDYSFLSHPLDYFTLALPLVYIIAAFGAVNYGLAVDEIVKNVLYFLAYWVVAQVVEREEDAGRLLHVIYLAAAGAALAGLFTATGLVYIKDGFLNGRIYSTFQYPNALASYLALAGFLGLFFWSHYGSRTVGETITDRALLKTLPRRLLECRPYRYFYAAANFIILAVFFGTRSRGGLLITGAVFVLYLIGLHWQKRLPVLLHALYVGGLGYIASHKFIAAAMAKQVGTAWLWILGGLALVLAGQWVYAFAGKRSLSPWLEDKKRVNMALASMILACLIAGTAVLTTHPQALEKVTSFTYLRNAFERTYFVRDAVAMIKDRPVLGWGGGGWEEAYRAYQGYLYNSNEVHSHYFQVAVETGMVGLLVMLGIWAYFLWAAHRAYWRAPAGSTRRAMAWAMTAGALAVGLHAAADFDLSLSALTLVLWALFACTRALSDNKIES
ncbi:O-antigen ligase family protein [Desulfofundulus thermosubterraneus]|uniref:O-antigen ligase n=1 Tax=Desulfofundulus thermosubterraneus DSM 16057 TaxID=1121432 RepID=A0A1M6FUJ7_9FIRM|nr:O-antigen ligase family protein [Desulfofundulus thermosubterraneus]SHJ01376.1 O-antigen ligase [Desulfofundulus thermosubterraneus DSM 16057]